MFEMVWARDGGGEDRINEENSAKRYHARSLPANCAERRDATLKAEGKVMSYWNADSDLDWSEPNMPDERLVSQCDCCGEYKHDCEDRTWRGMDVHACPKCRGAEEDEDADRGDWECHQRRGE